MNLLGEISGSASKKDSLTAVAAAAAAAVIATSIALALRTLAGGVYSNC